ncbi:MAG TPA: FAD-dependent oxidoreductase, partial [Saprospiraceae bacterium]|nr:FAD-dependent oxidoreductase [Saprospiraceae bacterium]
MKFRDGNKTVVIGAGLAGMACAALLAKSGHSVQLIEKHDTVGGRNRKWTHQGFQFDMGPSWYWMPDVFERFYQLFGHTHQDFYELKRLDPSYQVFWSDREPITLPADFDSLKTLFDGFEAGSGDRLAAFLKEAKIKYDTAMSEFIYRPSLHATEYADLQLIQKSMRLDLFQSIAKHIRKYVQDPHLVQLLEFPVLFLGAKPQETPALYSMMNYADMMLGTWYPMGGM